MHLYDAHNHLQDERFADRQDELVTACRSVGIVRMVVNGSAESDWPAIAELARRFPDLVIPSFGLHPWYVTERSPRWLDALRHHLDTVPGAVIGEIGLDRWILNPSTAVRNALASGQTRPPAASLAEQEDVFLAQLTIAAERNLPASLHCLQAWGAMEKALRAHPRPAVGFLLHSYGGPAEMIPALARRGAYFGFPGYFLNQRKQRQREAFRGVPADRLLIETDAPDQRLPEAAELSLPAARQFTLADGEGRPLNHPANLACVLSGLARSLEMTEDALAGVIEANFRRLFGSSGPIERGARPSGRIRGTEGRA